MPRFVESLFSIVSVHVGDVEVGRPRPRPVADDHLRATQAGLVEHLAGEPVASDSDTIGINRGLFTEVQAAHGVARPAMRPRYVKIGGPQQTVWRQNQLTPAVVRPAEVDVPGRVDGELGQAGNVQLGGSWGPGAAVPDREWAVDDHLPALRSSRSPGQAMGRDGPRPGRPK